MTRLRLAIAAPYAALWVAVVWWYPAIRGDVLLWLYTGAELAGGAVVVGCLVAWVCRAKNLQNRHRPARVFGERATKATGLQPTAACALALTSASLATTLLPALQGPAMIAGWPVVVTVWCLALGIVLGMQGWELLGKDARR